MPKLNDLEWMISVIRGAMDHGTLNYTLEEYKRMERLEVEIYGKKS